MVEHRSHNRRVGSDEDSADEDAFMIFPTQEAGYATVSLYISYTRMLLNYQSYQRLLLCSSNIVKRRNSRKCLFPKVSIKAKALALCPDLNRSN